MTIPDKQRDTYIDFLRAIGLLLLFIAHTAAPPLLRCIRTFDVPLMVMISAICYRPLNGGYLQYCKKRFVRIYKPVFIFLTFFFSVEFLLSIFLGFKLSIGTIIGSYLMLNVPSIGYVWIMRVFLMLALIIPLLSKLFGKINFSATIIIVIAIIALQSLLAYFTELIDNQIVRIFIKEYVLYAIGYSPIAIIGLKIKEYSNIQNVAIVIICTALIIGFMIYNHVPFDPQSYKYPPQSIYILYGIMASTLLWTLKKFLSRISGFRFFLYLSKNSMWLYLWHIIPVYALSRYMDVPGFWFARFITVIVVTLILFAIYSKVISKLKNFYILKNITN